MSEEFGLRELAIERRNARAVFAKEAIAYACELRGAGQLGPEVTDANLRRLGWLASLAID